MINVQILSKATQFATTLVPILCGTLIASVHSCIYDKILTNPNFNHTCDYNEWLPKV
jgi:hypothetical protein